MNYHHGYEFKKPLNRLVPRGTPSFVRNPRYQAAQLLPITLMLFLPTAITYLTMIMKKRLATD